MTLDKSSAFKTSANTEVLSVDSCTSFPYWSIDVAHPSIEFSASVRYCVFRSTSSLSSASSASAPFRSLLYLFTLSPVFCTTLSCASYWSFASANSSVRFLTSSLFSPYSSFALSNAVFSSSFLCLRLDNIFCSSSYFLTALS